MATLQSTTINDTGFLKLPVGTTAQRPGSPSLGYTRYNTTEEIVEFWNGEEWLELGSSGATVDDISPIQNESSMRDIAYAQMPSGPRTMLNYIQSFGVNQSSSNTANSTWNNGYDTLSFDFIDTGNYFLSGNAVLFNGDGSADGGDWVVWNFGPLTGSGGGGDWNPRSTNGSDAFFGGESFAGNHARGETNGYVWGFNDSDGWTLLLQFDLDQNPGFNKSNSNWYSSGSTVTSGQGKRAAYNDLDITYIGFSVD